MNTSNIINIINPNFNLLKINIFNIFIILNTKMIN